MQVAVPIVCFPHIELLVNPRKPRMEEISPAYLLNCVVHRILDQES